MTTFLLIRHASFDGVGERIVGRQKGIHLNEKGQTEAAALAERLANMPIAALYSSPLERAQETAEPIAKRLGVEIQTDGDLTEIDFGDWTGSRFEELEEISEWRRANFSRSTAQIPGGETLIQVSGRAIGLIERLRRNHPKSLIAIVSHCDWIRAAITHYSGIHLDLFQRLTISPASISILRVGNSGPKIIRLNDTGEMNGFL